jgi:hypothetical protein
VYDRIYAADFGKYFEQEFIDKYNEIARRSIYDLLAECLDKTLDTMFTENEGSEWETVFGSVEKGDLEQTKVLGKSFLRHYTFSPTHDYDLVNTLRDEFNNKIEKENLDLFIKTESGSLTGNPLIKQGFTIKIPYDKFEKLLTETIITFSFFSQSARRSTDGSPNKHSTLWENYRLVFEYLMESEQGEVIKNKLLNTFKEFEKIFTHNEIIKLFTENKNNDGTPNSLQPKFKIILYAETGSGMSGTQEIRRLSQYKNAEIDFEIPVNDNGEITDKISLYKGIGSLILYLLYEPRSFFVLKSVGDTKFGKPLIYGDICRIISLDYIHSTFRLSTGKIVTRGFLWDAINDMDTYMEFIKRFENKNEFFMENDLVYWKKYKPARNADNPNEPIFDVMRRYLYRFLAQNLRDSDGNYIFPIEGEFNNDLLDNFIVDLRTK